MLELISSREGNKKSDLSDKVKINKVKCIDEQIRQNFKGGFELSSFLYV